MFRWIIGTSLRFRFLVAGVATALVVFGTLQLRRMPLDVFPEFAPPVVEVQTEAIGLSAVDVESLITLNLEELLSGVPWLESVRSESVTGLSSIVLTFQRGTDLMKARQMIQERLTLAYTLPNVAAPPVIIQPLSATSRFMMVALSSDSIDPTDLSLLARWTVKPRLLGVPGVANVAIWGQRLRQLHVHFDPARLRDAQVTQDDVVTAAGDALWVSPLTFLRGSAPGTGGWIDNTNQRLGVHHAMPIRSPEDMAKVAVAAPHLLLTGRTMALGDVAEVTFAHPPLIGDASVAGGGRGLMLVIEKFPAANTLEVTQQVEQALAELGRGLPGVKVDTGVFRLASYVAESLSNLAAAMAVGGALVILVLGALLFDWRGALISVAAISLSLLAAVLALHLTGATINIMILAGLVVALGVVIDDAVVFAERLGERLRRPGRGSVAAVIGETALETRVAALYGTLIVILGATPVLFMGGVSGAFFSPLALSYVLAVVASMLVGLTVTPALALLLGERGGRTEPRGVRWLRRRVAATTRWTLRAPRAAVGVACLLVAAGLAAWPLLGQSLLPPLNERELLVDWATPPGTSYEETYRITQRVSRELRSLPGVGNVGAHVGRAVTGDQVVGINASQIWISLAADADRDTTIAAIRNTIDGYPGVDHSLRSYLRDKVGEVLTGQGKAITVRLYGQGREILRDKAEEIRQALSDVPGIVDLRAGGQTEEPQVEVLVNLDAAGREGVKPGDVRRSAATVFSGLVVGYLFEAQKIFEVVVWGAPETRASLTNLSDTLVEKSDRRHARLGDVAEVRIAPTPTVIRHERISPYVDVVANVAGRDLGSVSRDIDNRLRNVQFPLEYHAEVLGEYTERQDAQRRMLGVAAAALLGIVLLLQACFRSWRHAGIAVVALVASLAGGVLAALIGGGTISLGSLVGFLAVVGIAARNSILLITRLHQLEEGGRMRFGRDLVLQGVEDRLSPILASSAAIVVALVPIVALGGVPGLEIAQPTAVVMVGGVIASALATLLVVPALYLMAGPVGEHRRDLDLAEG
jgi:CzcA family heavy metal efflux pump